MRRGPIDNDPQQHDLLADAAMAVVATSQVIRDDLVLEAGAGLGALTAALLAHGARVHAVERDPLRVAALRERFPAELAEGRLALHAGDVRRVAPPLAAPWRVVANPPFALTADLVRHWLVEGQPDDPPVAMDLVLQLQAARKLCGGPGEESRSSVLVRLAGRARISMRLTREQTVPPSRVDLCVWQFRRMRDAPPPSELARIERLLARAFAGPHTVADALRGMATNVQLRRQGKEHGWDPAAHPRTLTPQAWRELAAILAYTGKLQ